MDPEERLHWLETRIQSSCKPRADDLRKLFTQDESRATLLEFFSNNDAHRLFVYFSEEEADVGGSLKVSLSPPVMVKHKSVCFVKTGPVSQLHSGNLDDSVTCMDWSDPLTHSNLLLREVFLPFLCTDSQAAAQQSDDVAGITQDKLMDILHRLLGSVEITKGSLENLVCLPLPSIEVLAEAAAFQYRQPAVVHVLESAVIGWIKQIRNVLRHDPLSSTKVISKEANEPTRPHHEVIMWKEHIQHLESIIHQLKAPVAMDILMNLTHASSSYAQSFGTIRTEVENALVSAKARLRCFTTILPWVHDMYRTSSLEKMLKVFPPLLHTVLLIWKHSDYYHSIDVFAHLLQMLSNEIVARARSLVGENPFEDTSKSYTALKDALRLCAAFRGTYLDFKEMANLLNEKNLETNVMSMARLRPKDHNVLFRAKMYGPTGFHQLPGDPQVDGTEEHWEDSAWPARNATCFQGLSRFVERCNDLLDLVETTRHFYTLHEAAQVGGAGSRALDALINDIHQVFAKTIKEFTKKNQDVLTIDDKQHFEKAFFHYRFVIKTLERRLAGVLRKSLRICPNPMSHLRVLEVFEGISAREHLQKDIAPENDQLVTELTEEFKAVKSLFKMNVRNVPRHSNLPPTVSKLFWVRALKQRISVPMGKLRLVCPHALESDKGWLLRDAFTEAMNELEKFESKLLSSWSRSLNAEIRDRLNNFVLATEAEEYTQEKDDKESRETPRERPVTIKVNLDQQLMEMLRDIKYLQKDPYELSIPSSLRALLRSVDSSTLHRQATRLYTVVSKYNHIINNLKTHELLLFEAKMRKVDELIQEGKEVVTWGSPDLEDYLEKITAVISDNVHQILTQVHNNWARVEEIAQSWSEGELDIFTSHQTRNITYSLNELLSLQEELDEQYKTRLIPGSAEIHNLLVDSFQAIEISAASPAWRLYTAQMDAVVLIAIKNSILTSLDAMYTVITAASNEEQPDLKPILSIRLELVEQTVSFSPPMDRTSSVDNVEDGVSNWINNYLKRASFINRLTDAQSSYSDFLSNDEDVWEILNEIQAIVTENATECKQLLSIFDNYRFLWVQDVQQSFHDFLNGRPSPNPLRASKLSQHKIQKTASQITGGTGQRSRYSAPSPDAVTEAERAFLTPHRPAITQGTRSLMYDHQSQATSHPRIVSSSDVGMETTVPGLSEFDEEIGIYKTARDNIASLPDNRIIGWLSINFQPIKEVLTTYASKWMWTFTKYLCDQVTDSLDTLADFLARTEPEIESITGEERDTASFMKMMRLFNEVSSQQQDMEERFSVMNRTVYLLEKYDMKLSNETQEMFHSAPDRWNHLKTKVSLAKQRLGPRIQEESARITRDLLRFGDRVTSLSSELRSSEVFSRDFSIHSAMDAIDGFMKRLRLLQTEAQDLIELQELLETAVVNFSILPQYQRDLKNLKATWEQKKMCEVEQREWKLKHWQRIDTKHLQQATRRQKEMIQSLPYEVRVWDVFHGMIDSTTIIEQCLPLVEDLNHPAMRTRHWKQLVRVTGGLLQTDTDSLKKMILGDLLELGLQKHAEEVKAIVQRAVKDLTIESSLKTCEEVWLGKVFELYPHTRGLSQEHGTEIEAGSEITGSEMMPHAVLQNYDGSRTTGGTRTKSMKSGPHSRSSDKTGPGSVSRGRGGGRTSVLSLPISLVNLVDDPSPICLLKNVEKIFSELEHHQMELYRMQSNSAIGSFLDEVTKWQKKLQLIEAVLDSWISVQEKWIQLDEIYSGADVRTSLAHEANMFAVISKDFRLLMRATEKNTNVLQSCSRKGLLPMLEKMDVKMDQCKHALLGNLERRRQRFPRFYFLSPEDVMNIVCYGYDLHAVNKFLFKVLPNLGELLFEEKENLPASANNKLKPPSPLTAKSQTSKKYFIVNGVTSSAGEKLILTTPIPYEGPMSQWLPRLIENINYTLKEKIHVALGFEPTPAQVQRDIRSAGASKVRVSRPSSAASHHSAISNKSIKPTELAGILKPITEGPSDLVTRLAKHLGGSASTEELSWILDNCTQVALLATSVQISKDIATALADDKQTESLQKVCEKLISKLDSTVIILKGVDNERSTRMRSARIKMSPTKNDATLALGAKKDGTASSESIGAPSTRSLLEDDIDIVGDDGSMDEGLGGDAVPINTMQSLLFTEQVKSGKESQHGGIELGLREILPQEKPEQPVASIDTRLALYPFQIHKIAGIIAMLSQFREFCENLLKNPSDSAKAFDYVASLQHIYDKDNMQISIKFLSWIFEYGYEYQGSCRRCVTLPGSEKTIISMCHALYTKSGVLLSRHCSSESSSPMIETLHGLSTQLGRALYTVQCTRSLDHFMLGDIFKGLAETGCWLCLERLSTLAAGILSVTCELANEVLQALRTGQPAIVLQSEEVTVSPTAALFATAENPRINVAQDKRIPTPTSIFPSEFLKNFRIISPTTPNPRALLEIQLLSHGFTHARELSEKLCALLRLCDSFFMSAIHSDSKVNGNNVVSAKTMEFVIGFAAQKLDAGIHEHMEKTKEYKDMVVGKTRKFADIWRYKTSTSASKSIQMVDNSTTLETDALPSDSAEHDQTNEEKSQAVDLEDYVKFIRKMEEESLVIALLSHITPKLSHSVDLNIALTVIQDLWPDVDVDAFDDANTENKLDDEYAMEINTEISIPVRQIDSCEKHQNTQESRENVQDIICTAIEDMKLCESSSFISRVAQLLNLAKYMKGAIVAGKPGSGKSTCIAVSVETQKKLGSSFQCKRVFVNALDSTSQLFGYYEPDNREWKDGLIQHLVRSYCLDLTKSPENASSNVGSLMLHADGYLDSGNGDIFLQLFHDSSDVYKQFSTSSIVLPNNECLRLPINLQVIWELETLDHLAPSTVAELGVLVMGNTDVTWKVLLAQWTQKFPKPMHEMMTNILSTYLTKITSYFLKATMPDHLLTSHTEENQSLKQTIMTSVESMTVTFFRLLSCLLASTLSDLSEIECERYIAYAAFWAFGGTLMNKSRDCFTLWWKQQFPKVFPSIYDPWNVFIDYETRDFAHWADHKLQFSGFGHSGGHLGTSSTSMLPSSDDQQRNQHQDEVFVHTTASAQLNHILGILTDAGYPVMIVGPAGCGKTALVRDRVNTVSSGEVAEVLSLFVHCNRLTQAGGLWDRVLNYLEWKHSITYTPRGNKKLLCVVDDLNLSKSLDMHGESPFPLQPACEMIRQHLDTGGVRNISSFKWQQVSNVTYIAIMNPNLTCSSLPQSQRLTRHFSVLTCAFPSVDEQKSIFSTILSSHFLHTYGSASSSGFHAADVWTEKPMENLLRNITMVTIELQEKLRTMYLSVPDRAHYSFTLNDLDKIFRNLLLSLSKNCRHSDLLLLWRHECDWAYGQKMVSDVDLERYHQAFDTSVRKYLTENKYLPSIVPSKQPLFSSVRELDSGFVTAGRYEGRSSQTSRGAKSGSHQDLGDYYQPAYDYYEIRRLLVEAVKEHNKVNVGMNLSLYKDGISLVCRLARIFQCPHKTGHTLLFGDGCPMIARLLVNLAAHLGGFNVRSLRPAVASTDEEAVDTKDARLAHFKEFMVNLYKQTGIKGEKVVLFLSDDRVITHECITILEELIRHGAISHLFTSDEQTTIANSVRSEVTAAGLTYSKDAAWNFFQSTVMKNLRIVLVCSDTGRDFMAKSLEFSSLFNRFNMVAMRPWSHEQLVEVTLYHIQKHDQGGKVECSLIPNQDSDAGSVYYKHRHRRPLDKKWMENVAHLLANMHIAVREKMENKFYKLQGHASNYTFEKFVQRFASVFSLKRKVVHQNQNVTAEALMKIDKENAIAESLQRELDREKQVLDEHKRGTTQLLAQIGQDMVITEQQVLAVKQQIKKIHHLRKFQPEYKHAHEKAVFKAAAIVTDTKNVVKEIDYQGLAELRSLQKPDNDVEDLMACIIMIVKSPNSDLTWSKGAKRQMANLDRFIDELMNFDDSLLPRSTLDALEPTLEKETFTIESLTAKTGGNVAAGALLKWVQGVVKYHTLMINKVKPLHDKLEETSLAIVGAQHRLRQLESKKEALESRLRDLAEGFEQATVDKNEQESKRLEMEEHLREAAYFQQVLMNEHKRHTAVLDACEDQLEWATGIAAVTAGFATYLGPYPYMLRRIILTVDWAQCLAERGILLVFDTIDPVRGHKIEFMLDVNDDVSELSEHTTGREEDVYPKPSKENENFEENANATEVESGEDSKSQDEPELDDPENLLPDSEAQKANNESENIVEERANSRSSKGAKERSRLSRPSTTVPILAYSCATLPFMSTEEYHGLLSCIVKELAGEDLMFEWLTKDYCYHQLLNASIQYTSWQRPPLLLDPYLAGVDWYASVFCQDKKIVPVNLSSRIGHSQILVMEKAILAGHTLILMDCEQQPGNFLRPLIYHANTTQGSGESQIDESRTIRWLGRRLACPDSFSLCMSTAQPASSLHPNIIAASQLVNYIPSMETLQEDLLNRALSRLRPQLFHERKKALQAIRQHKRTLYQLDSILNKTLIKETDDHHVEYSTKFISSIVDLKIQVFDELKTVENLHSTIHEFAEELFPIAQRCALLYSICRALAALDVHYQFPLPFFLHLFDSVIGKDPDEDIDDAFVLNDVKVMKPSTEGELHTGVAGDGSTSHTPDKHHLQERRKSKLRLGSASRVLKKPSLGVKLPDGDSSKSNLGNEAQADGELSGDKPSLENDSDGDESKHSLYEIVVPTVAQLPTSGVEYTNFPGEDIQGIVYEVTQRVFHHIYHSIRPEHRVHVAILFLLTIQLDDSMREDEAKQTEDTINESTSTKHRTVFSEEELTLLIHGNPGFGGGMTLNLEDFECKAPVPTWVPADQWEDILAFSVLPGPLEGICVHIAEHADTWRVWFESSCPEKEALPTSVNKDDNENALEKLSDFHELLLIRTLRSDRLLHALDNYVQKHISETGIDEACLLSGGPDRETMFKDISNTLGVLIELHDPHDPEVQATLHMSPLDAIQKLGKSCNINVHVVHVGDGCQPEVTHAIEQAHADDSWLVIHGLHYAPSKFFEDLQLHLARIGNISQQSDILGEIENTETGGSMPLKKSKAPKFLVWLTTLPSLVIPPTLTQYLYKLSWKSLLHVASDSENQSMKKTDVSLFKKSILGTLEMIPEDKLHAISQMEARSFTLFYAVCICHCVALCGQSFSWHALTKRYALSNSILMQALSYIDGDDEIPYIISLIKNLYGDVITCDQDKLFMDTVLENVLSQAIADPSISKLKVNGVEIKVPPITAMAGISDWIEAEILDDVDTAKLVSVHPSALFTTTTLMSETHFEQLQALFSSAQKPDFESSVAVANVLEQENRKVPLTLSALHSSIGMCLEQLPNLLEVGGSQDLLANYIFPYQRPSVMSNVELSNTPFPECISYILMKECLWFNQLLCHIYQQLHELKTSLMQKSDYKLSSQLEKTADALIAEDVPESWIHPYQQPETHTLLTWLSDINMRYKQFRSWIREGLVPNTSRSPVGNLTSIWLGGLVNPKAFLTALVHEKAVSSDVSTEKVKMKCKVLMESDVIDSSDERPNVILKSVHVMNMVWNAEKACLSKAEPGVNEMNELPSIYLYLSLDDEELELTNVYEFPLYLNVTRQAFICRLPLPIDQNCIDRSGQICSEMLHSSVVLQTGVDAVKRDLCKTRAFMARKRREEWNKVSVDLSDLMSRSATRFSSDHQSVSGYPMSIASIGRKLSPDGEEKRDSVASQATDLQTRRKSKRKTSFSSSAEQLTLEASSKLKSGSQVSLSSHGSSMPPPSLSNKPPSRVLEEPEDENDPFGHTGEKPLPNGRIIHKEPSHQLSERDRPADGVNDTPDKKEVISDDFFDIKRPPSTEASLLQSLMDEDGSGTGEEHEGSQKADQPFASKPEDPDVANA